MVLLFRWVAMIKFFVHQTSAAECSEEDIDDPTPLDNIRVRFMYNFYTTVLWQIID